MPGLSCSTRDLRCSVFSCGTRVGSSSLTRDRTQAPCIGSADSYSLDHQGSPCRLTNWSAVAACVLRCRGCHWERDFLQPEVAQILTVNRQLVYWSQGHFSNWASKSCRSYLGKNYAISPSISKVCPAKAEQTVKQFGETGRCKESVRWVAQIFTSLSASRDFLLFKCKFNDVPGWGRALSEKAPGWWRTWVGIWVHVPSWHRDCP